MLRVIAGKYRHIKLEQPDSKITRPTTDKVREAVFSSLQFKIADKKCLDLFSGSGAWSIEAMSRGANSVDAIELNKSAYKVIQKNIQAVKENNINLINTDAKLFIEKTSKTYDFIFMDAPFKETELVNHILEKIAEKEILNPDGEIIIETDVQDKIVIPERFRIFKEKNYSKINLIYVCRVED
ncbi:16S rRNA (guanine(966)-N(2))-methyltransferase RsmD [Mycoplasma hafezii]|uniref:16S rRNA (guanine(966)-N(2))-methyltransferase RsmD n=1 Tax=Mycoplasma hafezii TaxID=525886 RepID=UPI003CF7A765